MNVRDAQAAIRRLMAQIEEGQRRGLDKALSRALVIARRQSSGRLSSSALARADHPYARRHGSPRRDPSRINVQTGTFRAAWESRLGFGGFSGGYMIQRGQIVNEARVADWLDQGTRVMFRRPIREAIEAKIGLEAEAIFEQAIRARISRVL